jgi:hypothetical protein
VQRQGIIDPVLRGALKLRSCAAQCDIELMPKKQILGFEPASRLEVFAKKVSA